MRLIMNDDTVLEDAGAGQSKNILWLLVPYITMQDAARIAFDEDKTEKIECQYGEMSDVYEGFTRCTHLIDDGEKITIGLTREVG